MSTLTPILGLKKPQTTDTVPQTLTDIGFSFDIIDHIGINKVTSGTHPGSPTYGDMIVETNTGNLLIYYGATTGWAPPWNTAWGILARTNVVTNQSGLTTPAQITGLSVTYANILLNRKIKVVSTGNVNCTASTSEVQWQIKSGATLLSRHNYITADFGNIAVRGEYHYNSSVAGSVTFDTYAGVSGSGTGTFGSVTASNQPAVIYIEDMGPSAPPA